MYSLLFNYLISIISFVRELTLLAYILVIVLLWRLILFLALDLAILDICFSPGHYTPIVRGR